MSRQSQPQPTSQWTGKGSDPSWFNAANWRGGVPVAGTRAVFKTGHADLVGLRAPAGTSAAAGEVVVTGDHVTFRDGTLTMTPPAPRHGPTIDLSVSGGGRVAITAAASLIGQGEVLIGNGTTDGTLSVRGTLSDSQGAIIGPTSRALVAGAGNWTNTSDMFVSGASSQNAELVVNDGGTVDGGPNALTTGFASVEIGNGFGAGLAIVAGAGSLLTATVINVGTGYSGTLEIRDGAHVVDRAGSAGGNGDGTVDVSGAGSLWQNLFGLQVGMQVPVASAVTITHHGAVSFGSGGMSLDGKLAMDATATLQGAGIVSAGGAIYALDTTPGAGDTGNIGSSLELTGNPLAPFQLETTYVGSDPQAVLDLSGAISVLDPNAILQVGVGHVVLSNSANSLPTINLYGGVLEVGATGATGSAAMYFLAGSSPTLQVDAGVTVANAISGFGARDAFDLTGVAFGSGLIPGWTPGTGGGTLSVSDGMHTESLHLLGSYSAASFLAGTDGNGGTLVTFVPGHPA